MIELPDSPCPNGMEPVLIDYGSIVRGASSLRINRPGSRYRVTFSYPPMIPDKSRQFVARLLRAKREGLKIKLPLIVSQGLPGSPVVDGVGQSGTAVKLRGFTPGYIAKEGYWLTIAGSSGAFLHTVAETVTADGSGDLTLQIEPALRAPFADGDTVEIAAPWVEGFVDGEDWGWQIPVNRLIAVSFTVEEYK